MAKPKIIIDIKAEETLKFLKNLPKEKMQKADRELVNQAVATQNEVKNSIRGELQEPRSVDTGRFLSSVSLEIQKEQAKVFTELEYAKFLEYGTTSIESRKHFTNSATRMRPKIVEAVKQVVK